MSNTNGSECTHADSLICKSCVPCAERREAEKLAFELCQDAECPTCAPPCAERPEPCNEEGCPDCCEHSEHEHFVCNDCGKQMEPSDYYSED